MDAGQVVGIRDHEHLQPPGTGGDLRDGQAHCQQQDRRADVRAAVDGEALVGAGEEEVEPRDRGQGCQAAGEAVAGGGDRDDGHDHDQGQVRARYAAPEWHQDERQQQWTGHGCCQRDAVTKQKPGHRRTSHALLTTPCPLCPCGVRAATPCPLQAEARPRGGPAPPLARSAQPTTAGGPRCARHALVVRFEGERGSAGIGSGGGSVPNALGTEPPSTWGHVMRLPQARCARSVGQ